MLSPDRVAWGHFPFRCGVTAQQEDYDLYYSGPLVCCLTFGHLALACFEAGTLGLLCEVNQAIYYISTFFVRVF